MRRMRGWILPGLIAAGLSIAATVAVTAAAPGKAHSNKGRIPHVSSMFELGGQRGRLGVEVMSMSDELRGYFGAPAGSGVLVNRVVDGSPAKAAGLRAGDVILSSDGEDVADGQAIVRSMDDRKKGDKVAVVVMRDKQRVTLSATLAEDPRPEAEAFAMPFGGQGGPSGGWTQQFGFPSDDRLDALEKRLDALEKHR